MNNLIRIIKKAIKNPRKACDVLIHNFLMVCLGMPPALLILLLRPIVFVRIVEIQAHKLGGLVIRCDIYLSEKRLGRHRGFVDLFFLNGKPINKAVTNYFGTEMTWRRWLKWPFVALKKIAPNSGHLHLPRSGDIEGVLVTDQVNIPLSQDIIKRGDEWLAKFGVSPDDDVLLFANRDSVHLSTVLPDRDWSYHDYRDFPIDDMLPMVEVMTQKGYYAVRVGAHVAAPVETDNSRIIDYSSLGWSEEMDLYLGHRCKMMISTTSGVVEIARLFRKPIGYVNASPFLTMTNIKTRRENFWCPKLYYSKHLGRCLTFQEIVDSGHGNTSKGHILEDAGIELINNTPEEIITLAEEMDASVNGRFSLGQEDETLIRRFYDILGGMTPEEGFAQISAGFLRKHQSLL